MRKILLPFLAAAMSLLSLPAFSQADKDTTELLGLPGDNLDLYAVLTLFQKSKTIEAFEKSLNDEKTGVNNLDLNLDKKVDFIKVVTRKDSSSNAFTFILQVDVTKTETQDVAIILVNKDKEGKVSIQAVGDEELYGKDYVIEPKGNSPITANPGYTGENPVTVSVPATTTVVVQSAPIVQYVYSPAYVPYYPPYYYGYYPAWFGFATVMAVGIYRSNHWGYHGGYYGGHYGGGGYYHGGNNVVINNGNRNQINHYNNSRNTSNTVSDNRAKGNYGNGSANRPTTSNRPSAGTSNRPSAGTSNLPSGGASNRASTGASNRSSTGTSNRASTSNMSSGGSGRTRSSSSGGYSGGGGGMRGGGGGGRRR
jgi:hypothetical protein